jgi:hypothetical protein
MAARVWLFDSWKPHNHSRSLPPIDLPSASTRLHEEADRAEMACLASRYCAPGAPSLGVLHAPLLQQLLAGRSLLMSDLPSSKLDQTALGLSDLNETEVDAFVERLCGQKHLAEFCSSWDGIQLCSLYADPSGPYNIPATELRRREVQVFKLVPCNSTHPHARPGQQWDALSAGWHGLCEAT